MHEAGAKSSSVPPAEKRAVTESLATGGQSPQAAPFRRIDRVCLGDVRGIRRR